MPYRKEQFVNGEFYHIVTRGIDDNLIFKDINDYYRGIFSIYEFNNTKPVSIKNRRAARLKMKKLSRGPSSGDSNPLLEVDERDRIVDVLSFCFMPNHIHLLMRQIKDGGIIKFMSKIGTGYGGYSNRRYKRKGYVFQNRFKDVHIKNDDQLRAVFTYIHTNPISLIEPGWKELGIKDPQKVIKFLEEDYRWSSYHDYIGKKNFPSVTMRDFLLEIMGGEQGCKAAIENWVKHKEEKKQFPDILLD